MKESVAKVMSKFEQELSGLFSLLNYRYCNICVEASAVSLLPVKLDVDGRECNFEEVADVAMDEENKYIMKVFPKDEMNLREVGRGIAVSHPEFKQDLETMKLSDTEEMHYILLTMPEVNKDRRKVMIDETKALYDDCKARMKSCKTRSTADITKELIGGSAEDIDNAKKELDKVSEQYEKMRDELSRKKEEEIEKAYEDYMKRKESADRETSVKDAENDTSKMKSLKL